MAEDETGPSLSKLRRILWDDIMLSPAAIEIRAAHLTHLGEDFDAPAAPGGRGRGRGAAGGAQRGPPTLKFLSLIRLDSLV